MTIRATKLELLEFVEARGYVRAAELVAWWGYTYNSAEARLHLLRRQGLALSDGHGNWSLTEKGFRRLEWLREKQGKATWP